MLRTSALREKQNLMTTRAMSSERESATDRAEFHLAKSRFSTADKQLSPCVMLQLRFPGTEIFLAVFQRNQPRNSTEKTPMECVAAFSNSGHFAEPMHIDRANTRTR